MGEVAIINPPEKVLSGGFCMLYFQKNRWESHMMILTWTEGMRYLHMVYLMMHFLIVFGFVINQENSAKKFTNLQ